VVSNPVRATRALGLAAVLAATGPIGLAQAQDANAAKPAAARIGMGAEAGFVVRAVRAERPPVIDGRLDDEVWASVGPEGVFDNFTQVEPIEGAAPSERTEVRVLFDRDNLYLGIRCYTRDPSRIVARQMARDGEFNGDDFVTVVIDTFLDRRTGYLFQVSAAGGKTDGLLEPGRQRNDWDGIWDAKVTRDEQGWVVEMAIPAKTVSFDPEGTAWGLNVGRLIRWNRELVRWSGPSQNVRLTDMAAAGEVQDLEGLDQGWGLTLRPYVSTRVDLDTGGVEIKPGGDIFYKLSPSTTLAVTVNTDFAEAEVDDRRVNLTRFPLFFPEKRAFFLQDQQVFSFGGIVQSPLPFYSRRIGLVRGEQRDILAGIKITGREDRVTFGLLNVQMYDDRQLGSKNLSVGRVAVNILEESSVGAIFTHGDPSTTGDNTLAGADLNLRYSKLPGGRVIEGRVWAQGSHQVDGPAGEGNSDTDTSVGGRISLPNDDLNLSMFIARIGENYRPALGFTSRTGVYEYRGTARYRWRPSGFIRRIDVGVGAEIYTDLDGELQSQAIELPDIALESEDGDGVFVEVQHLQENLTEPFAIQPGVVIPVGEYPFNRVQIGAYTAASRMVSMRGEIETGDFYNGRRNDYTLLLEFRPSASLFFAGEYELNDVKLPAGDFIVRVLRARATVQFTPELSWSNTVQYDNVSDNVGVNSKVRWEYRPGSDLFVVFNQGYLFDDNQDFIPTDSTLTVKLGATIRF
jgi:hypothetical protein